MKFVGLCTLATFGFGLMSCGSTPDLEQEPAFLGDLLQDGPKGDADTQYELRIERYGHYSDGCRLGTDDVTLDASYADGTLTITAGGVPGGKFRFGTQPSDDFDETTGITEWVSDCSDSDKCYSMEVAHPKMG